MHFVSLGRRQSRISGKIHTASRRVLRPNHPLEATEKQSLWRTHGANSVLFYRFSFADKMASSRDTLRGVIGDGGTLPGLNSKCRLAFTSSCARGRARAGGRPLSFPLGNFPHLQFRFHRFSPFGSFLGCSPARSSSAVLVRQQPPFSFPRPVYPVCLPVHGHSQ